MQTQIISTSDTIEKLSDILYFLVFHRLSIVLGGGGCGQSPVAFILSSQSLQHQWPKKYITQAVNMEMIT